MWLARKDKVLVCEPATANPTTLIQLRSISLGSPGYRRCGFLCAWDLSRPEPCSDDPSRLCEATQVDFVEGLTVIIAIVIVVLIGSLND